MANEMNLYPSKQETAEYIMKNNFLKLIILLNANVNDPITTDPIDNGICSGKHCLDSSTIRRLINGNIYMNPITIFLYK